MRARLLLISETTGAARAVPCRGTPPDAVATRGGNGNLSSASDRGVHHRAQAGAARPPMDRENP
jgi:hypothetical protein